MRLHERVFQFGYIDDILDSPQYFTRYQVVLQPQSTSGMSSFRFFM